ncbi:MAG: YfcE family phosphodiesterase [Clostridia bacterium]|nr:YfcE family phosphodiesterase [Clostridia bacterium]
MTRILVVSDSHGYVPGLERIIDASAKKYGIPDLVLHCGDGAPDLLRVEENLRALNPAVRLTAVRGNCDGSSCADIPFERVVEAGGARIFMAHGHRHAVKSTIWVLDDAAKEQNCSIALFGHTHVPFMQMASVLILNPGCAHMGQYLSLEITNGKPRIHLDHL